MYRKETKEEFAKRKAIHNGNKLAEYQCELSDMIMALGDDYKVEEKDDHCIFTSHNPMEIERITIGHKLNSFDVVRFYVEVEQFDRDTHEVETSDSFGCNWECYDPEMEDDVECDDNHCCECDKLDKCESQYAQAYNIINSDKPDKEIKEWQEEKPQFLSIAGCDIRWSQVVDEFYCPNNIAHYHTIKGYKIEVDSQSLAEVVGITQLRDIFFRIQTFLSQEASI